MTAISEGEQQAPAAEEFHTFGVDELFFSTTDLKGIIEKSNSVFERVSHYAHDELVGAPHNIIRHPDMPGGAFKLVWDQIEAGKPASVYVKNLAKDGKSYWVLATLMPVADKYLSVRLAPCVLELRDLCCGVYDKVNAEEQRLRGLGVSRAKAAEFGAGQIAEAIGGLGMHDLTDLAATILPAEMSARAEVSQGIPKRPGATGRLARMLEAVQAISDATDRHVAALGDYSQLAAEVGTAAEETHATMGRLRELTVAASRGAEAVSGTAPVLVNTAKAMRSVADKAAGAILEARQALLTAQGQLAGLRMRIALSRLHTDMVGNFTAELIDGREPPGAGEAILLLCTALDEGLRAMTDDLARLSTELCGVARLVESATAQTGDFRRWACQYRLLVTREGLWAELGTFTGQIDDLMLNGFSALDHLNTIASRCRHLNLGFDSAAISHHLETVRSAAVAA